MDITSSSDGSKNNIVHLDFCGSRALPSSVNTEEMLEYLVKSVESGDILIKTDINGSFIEAKTPLIIKYLHKTYKTIPFLNIVNNNQKLKEIYELLLKLNTSLINNLNYNNKTLNVDFHISRGVDINCTDNDENTPLHFTVKNGSVKTVEALLKKGAEIDIRNIYNQTPLHEAVRYGQENIVKLLILYKANLEAKTKIGFTPLHLAAHNGYLNITKDLIEAGAKLNIKNNEGRTPLQTAEEEGKLEVVLYLSNIHKERENNNENIVEENETINIIKKNNLNEIISSSKGTSDQLAKLVVKWICNEDIKVTIDSNGEFIEVTNPNYLLSFYRVLQKKEFEQYKSDTKISNIIRVATNLSTSLLANTEFSFEKVKFFIKRGADINFRNSFEQTALHLAVIKGQFDIVNYLLCKGVAIDVCDNLNYTPLHEACRNGYLGIVKLLIASGANVNCKSNENFTPLHFAASNNYPNILLTLLNAGANIENKNHLGNTPLHLSVTAGCLTTTRILLETSQKLDKKIEDYAINYIGLSPLHYAAYCGYLQITELLLDYNCDITFKNIEGKTASDAAKDTNNIDVFNLLSNYKQDRKKEDEEYPNPKNRYEELFYNLATKVNNKEIEIIEDSLGRYIQVKEDKILLSLAHHLVKLSKIKGPFPSITPLEINTHKILEVIDNLNKQLLEEAGNSLDNVKLLIARGADVNYCNDFNNTPLHKAICRKKKDIVKYLLSKNAEVNTVNNSEDTPLSDAIFNKDFEIIKLLLEHNADVHKLRKDNCSYLQYVVSSSLEITLLLLKYNVDISIRSFDGRSLIHNAVLGGNIKIIKALHKHSKKTGKLLDINAQDNNGNTALHFAARLDKRGIFKYLLKIGANPNIKNNKNLTPLDVIKPRVVEDTLKVNPLNNDIKEEIDLTTIKIISLNSLLRNMTIIKDIKYKVSEKFTNGKDCKVNCYYILQIIIIFINGKEFIIEKKYSNIVSLLIIGGYYLIKAEYKVKYYKIMHKI
ncbi:MAG: ankyrin repeat domain-containing protein [Sphingobacteriia bacterium]|nr:ankyrin repeat domain-containing protein [Sphingobacteriia bacterium]